MKIHMQTYQSNPDKPSAYIFDVDGTLALIKNRGPFDWKKVGQDVLNVPVYRILDMVRQAGHKIIIFSGRDGICMKETKDWLALHNITWDHFIMRPVGNSEKDSSIKLRMFNEIKDDYNILGVFDDRDQVVHMWRSLGLTCFQVAEGNF